MGAGGSTLTETDVNRIVDDKDFVKESDLNAYAKTSSLSSYAKSSDLATNYLNKITDKVSDSTSKTDTTKWVTPKWVTDNTITQNLDETKVADRLLRDSTFRNNLVQPLSENGTLQSGVASGLLTTTNKSNFMSSLNTEFTNSDEFKTSLADVLTTNDTYVSALRGLPGTFNEAAVNRFLWSGGTQGGVANVDGSKVMWCADGDLCQVPRIKKGIVFTGSDQILSGSGTAGSRIVRVDDHIGLNMGGSIDFVRNKGTIGTGTGALGPNDGRILANIEKPDATATNAQMENAALEIHGIERLKTDGKKTSKKIKMFDDVEIAGKLKLGPYTFEIEKDTSNNEHLFIKKGDDAIARFSSEWDRQVIYHTPNARDKYFYINKDRDFGLQSSDSNMPSGFQTASNGREIVVPTNIISGRQNGQKWIIHNPGNRLIIAPDNANGVWDWGKELSLNRDGNIYLNNGINVHALQVRADAHINQAHMRNNWRWW